VKQKRTRILSYNKNVFIILKNNALLFCSEWLKGLNYADGICLLSHRKSHKQTKLADHAQCAKKMGLGYNL
jgi:hypothetical protein